MATRPSPPETISNLGAVSLVSRALGDVRQRIRPLAFLTLVAGAVFAAIQVGGRDVLSRKALNLIQTLPMTAQVVVALSILAMPIGGKWPPLRRMLASGVVMLLGSVLLEVFPETSDVSAYLPGGKLLASIVWLVVWCIGIFVMVRLALWPLDLLLGPPTGPRRSWRLMHGHVWMFIRGNVLLFLPVIGLIVVAIAMGMDPKRIPAGAQVALSYLGAAAAIVQQAFILAVYRDFTQASHRQPTRTEP